MANLSSKLLEKALHGCSFAYIEISSVRRHGVPYSIDYRRPDCGIFLASSYEIMTSRFKDPTVNEEAFSEQDSYERELSAYDVKAQQAEITPVEAFKQNVDGDQSPCIISHPKCFPRPILTVNFQFPRSPPVCLILTIQISHAIVSIALNM